MNNEQVELVVTEKELVVNMLLAAWDVQAKRFDAFLEKITDTELATETAPGRNTGKYLLGHLIAVNAHMLELMGFPERLHPELEDVFLRSSDKSGKEMPSTEALRAWHKEVTGEMHSHFSKMSTDDWFGRHTAVSAEDFAKEPHRNKLNVLISRTSHLAYHMGQLIYLVKK